MEIFQFGVGLRGHLKSSEELDKNLRKRNVVILRQAYGNTKILLPQIIRENKSIDEFSSCAVCEDR